MTTTTTYRWVTIYNGGIRERVWWTGDWQDPVYVAIGSD